MTELTNMTHGDDFPKGPIVFATDDDTRLEVEALKQEVARLNKLRDDLLFLTGGTDALEARIIKLEAFQVSSEKPKPRVVDKTARRKIADLQKAIEHLATQHDHFENVSVENMQRSIERIWIRQRKLIGRLRKVEAMLGIASPAELVAVSDG